MTERTFRTFLGAGLLILLYFASVYEQSGLIYAYIGLLLFEGVTNWRVPKLVSSIRKRVLSSRSSVSAEPLYSAPIPFEAERAMRLVVAVLLILSVSISTDLLWAFPWFVASMLFLAGVTNICPLVMFFRWLGFR